MNAVDAALIDAAVTRLPNPSLQPVREVARQKFKESGFPTKREEAWRYTDLTPIAELTARWLRDENAIVESTTETVPAPHAVDAHWLVIRNGELETPLNEFSVEGVSVRRLSELKERPSLKLSSALSSLNAALMNDALVIDVHDGATLEKPLGILFQDDTTTSVKSSHTRVLVRVGTRATAAILELHTSAGDAEHYANAVTEFRVESSAHLSWAQVQQRDDNHMMTSTTDLSVASEATFNGASVQLGGKLIRNAVNVVVEGPAAHATVNGLTISDGAQHIDNRVFADHAQPGGTTQQHYRGIAAGQSRNIFNSKALVRAGADGTDAEQSSHNLLLSDRAEIDTKPELEIYADDVKCAHGATIGELDAEALFYLRTRGIDEHDAKQMMTRAFADQIFAKLPIAAAETFIEEAISDKLERVIEAASQ